MVRSLANRTFQLRQRQQKEERSRCDAFRKVLTATPGDAATKRRAHEWLEGEVLSRAVIAYVYSNSKLERIFSNF